MTNPITTAEVILKADERRRAQTPVVRRESLLDEFERSVLSAAKFAALVGVKYQTFAAWALRQRRQRGAAKPATANGDSVRWLEALVTSAANSDGAPPPGVLVRLPSGLCLEVADAPHEQPPDPRSHPGSLGQTAKAEAPLGRRLIVRSYLAHTNAASAPYPSGGGWGDAYD